MPKIHIDFTSKAKPKIHKMCIVYCVSGKCQVLLNLTVEPVHQDTLKSSQLQHPRNLLKNLKETLL